MNLSTQIKGMEITTTPTEKGSQAYSIDGEMILKNGNVLHFQAENDEDPTENGCDFRAFNFILCDSLTGDETKIDELDQDALIMINDLLTKDMESIVNSFAHENK